MRDRVSGVVAQIGADGNGLSAGFNAVAHRVCGIVGVGKLDELCDTIWYIYASPEVRIERLMASRGYTREKCLSILDKQSSDETYRALSDIVLNNDGTPEQTREQIHMLLDDLFETDTPEDGGATL